MSYQTGTQTQRKEVVEEDGEGGRETAPDAMVKELQNLPSSLFQKERRRRNEYVL